jgi:UDP-3-O-[3-hydroxymyristoyl] glucosamine N-acyltransferase
MSVKIREILDTIDYLSFIGNEDQIIERPVPLDSGNKDPEVLMWVNQKNLGLLDKMQAGSLIVPQDLRNIRVPSGCNLILVKNPRRTFLEVLTNFFVKSKERSISETATIHKSVFLDKNVGIGANVVIEANCRIGENTFIDHNTVIKENTVIGKNVVIGCNNTIGGAGYGYEKNETGEYEFIPHLGNVVIKDYVEIGNNTCIDRAVLGSTILEEHVKIDNLVHIAHGVHAGRNSMIIANSMVAGSVNIGEEAWIAPSASILNQKSIGYKAVIGMGAVVIKDVPEKTVFVGNPAKDLAKK